MQSISGDTLKFTLIVYAQTFDFVNRVKESIKIIPKSLCNKKKLSGEAYNEIRLPE